ncbi:hypothetical protein GBAR_LOCUS6245 [Geodia barretti]|uniref:Uncharacterized protein n=1 Tax=Geodia barretti TaxID=519541 RepID=A0AA35W5U6_GEOBA|nr:hypothetical protein GBAR_LOCUS6245 [Geodia barretti]
MARGGGDLPETHYSLLQSVYGGSRRDGCRQRDESGREDQGRRGICGGIFLCRRRGRGAHSGPEVSQYWGHQSPDEEILYCRYHGQFAAVGGVCDVWHRGVCVCCQAGEQGRDFVEGNFRCCCFVFRVGSAGRSTGSVVCSLPCPEMVLQDTPIHVTSIALFSLDFLNIYYIRAELYLLYVYYKQPYS